jgi:signal transduction histidine kinase
LQYLSDEPEENQHTHMATAFRNRLFVGIGLALAVMFTIALLSYRSAVRNASDRQWVVHTYQVLERLDLLVGDLLEAESAQRGFILSHDDSYLKAYDAARAHSVQLVSELRGLTADNPTQQHSLDSLEPLVSRKFAVLEDRIDIRKQSGLEAAADSVRQGYGRELMDQIRALVSTMTDEENRLLVQRSNALDASSQQTGIVILLGNGLAIFFLGSAGWLIRDEFVRRRRAEDEVRLLNINLENKVDQRTAELAERAKDLARSNAELQQFAYVASHDLQEPLRMVASFTQLLAKRYGDRLDEDAREFIAYAVDGATRMQTLITDLLAFSRVGTQGKPFEPTECDAVLNRVLAGLKLAIEESKAVIRRDPLPRVMADPGQLGQLFQNILTNAVKFHGENPPRIYISARQDGENWKFGIRDNGIGISAEHYDRIFVIFQRLHTKVEYPGTGIGLAICKKIVERHGGRIWVEASPGGGSVFCFTIPVLKTQSKPGAEQNERGVPTFAN